jgi:hypothetical protein
MTGSNLKGRLSDRLREVSADRDSQDSEHKNIAIYKRPEPVISDRTLNLIFAPQIYALAALLVAACVHSITSWNFLIFFIPCGVLASIYSINRKPRWKPRYFD